MASDGLPKALMGRTHQKRVIRTLGACGNMLFQFLDSAWSGRFYWHAMLPAICDIFWWFRLA